MLLAPVQLTVMLSLGGVHRRDLPTDPHYLEQNVETQHTLRGAIPSAQAKLCRSSSARSTFSPKQREERGREMGNTNHNTITEVTSELLYVNSKQALTAEWWRWRKTLVISKQTLMFPDSERAAISGLNRGNC